MGALEGNTAYPSRGGRAPRGGAVCHGHTPGKISLRGGCSHAHPKRGGPGGRATPSIDKGSDKVRPPLGAERRRSRDLGATRLVPGVRPSLAPKEQRCAMDLGAAPGPLVPLECDSQGGQTPAGPAGVGRRTGTGVHAPSEPSSKLRRAPAPSVAVSGLAGTRARDRTRPGRGVDRPPEQATSYYCPDNTRYSPPT